MRAGPLYKVGAASDGRTWIFHESGYDADAGSASGTSGIQQTNPGLSNFVTRNNAWQVDRYVVETTSAVGGPAPDMDYDALFTTDASGRFVKWFEVLRPSLAALQARERTGAARPAARARNARLDRRRKRRFHAASGARRFAMPGSSSRASTRDLEDPSWNFVRRRPRPRRARGARPRRDATRGGDRFACRRCDRRRHASR